jgi:membrane associated rhomboid family serine protease/Zn-finger nucleic acid-binding protein
MRAVWAGKVRVWACPRCDSRATTIEGLRRADDDAAVKDLWQQAREGQGAPGRPCPACAQRMRLITLRRDGVAVDLDVCRSCHLVWFDAGELALAVPASNAEALATPRDGRRVEAAARVSALPPEARAALGEFLATSVRASEERKDEQRQSAPEAADGQLLQALGSVARAVTAPALGSADGSPGLDERVWVAPAAAALATVVFSGVVLLLGGAELANQALRAWGLDPLHPWRQWGLTWLTAPFLELDLWRVASSAYFLMMVGGLVEETAGTARFVALAALGALAGEAAQVLASLAVGVHPGEARLLTGADGMVALLLTFYSLSFPQARVGFPRRVGKLSLAWARYPAWGGLGAWLAMVALVGWLESEVFPAVALSGTLAGAAAGFACWRLAGQRGRAQLRV